VLTYDGLLEVVIKINSVQSAGRYTALTAYAFFRVYSHAAAFSRCYRARQASFGACRVDAAVADRFDKFTGYSAVCADFYATFLN